MYLNSVSLKVSTSLMNPPADPDPGSDTLPAAPAQRLVCLYIAKQENTLRSAIKRLAKLRP